MEFIKQHVIPGMNEVINAKFKELIQRIESLEAEITQLRVQVLEVTLGELEDESDDTEDFPPAPTTQHWNKKFKPN